MAMLFIDARLGQQAAIRARRTDGDGVFKVLQGAVLLVADGGGAADAVVHAGNEDLADELFAHALILGEADVLPGFGILPGLQPAGSGEQGELGAVGVVLQGVAAQLGEALPVAELPLRPRTFEQVFIERYKVRGARFKGRGGFRGQGARFRG